MKKVKIIVFMCFLILLTGCSAEANVVMDEYGKVSENVIISEKLSNLNPNKNKAEIVLKSTLNKYKSALDSREYNYDTKIKKNNGIAEFTNSYSDIMNYFESTVFSQYVYKQMKWTETDEYFEIRNVSEHITYCDDCSDWPVLSYIRVNITLPVSATEQNADEVDGNTYIWKYDKNTKDKNFYLKISKSALEENKKNYIKNQEIKKNRSKIINIGIIVGAILIIAGAIFVFYKKKYKKNNFDYE